MGLAAASAAVVTPAAAQAPAPMPAAPAGGTETSPWPGVVVRSYSGSSAIIPGYRKVSMRDIIMQPGSKTAGPPMPNPMVCHILEGEMRLDQNGKSFTAKKNHVWTCNKGTKEQAFNESQAVAIMRITDLMA
jgi:hypothetical protein